MHLPGEAALWTPQEAPIQFQLPGSLFAGGSLQVAVGVECGQGVPHTPFIPPPRFSCLRCWRPVAKQPITSFLTPSCSNSRISMPSCLSGCLGGSVERPGHLSKSWALTLSTRHCLGPYFALRKGRFPFSPDWGWRGCLHTERRPKTWEW